MKKNLLPYVATAIMLIFFACSNENLTIEEKTEIEAESIITITASMPDDNPDTRISLTRDEKNIKLAWQAGDWLQFAYVQGTTKIKQSTQISANNIDSSGKRVTFSLTPPSAINPNQPYTLYGVYGYYSQTPEEGGISNSNPTNVILTKEPGSRGTIELVQNRGDVMLYFKANKTPNNPLETVNFKHLGSLFAISFNSTVALSSTSGITQARLVGVDSSGNTLQNGNWAYNNGDGGEIFDLITEEQQNQNSGGNYISFSLAGSSWNSGETTTLWGWYPPKANEAWPALRLEIADTAGNTIISSVNFKPARTAPTPVGKVFHFYAEWDGTDLVFTNNDFTSPSPALD